MVHGELWGITAEGWIAIATLFGGLAVLASGGAVLYGIMRGAQQFLGEREAADVQRYLVEEGVWKLKASLDRTLQTVRLNYAQCLHLLRHVRDFPAGNPGAPSLEDLPRLFPMDPQDFAFDAIRPASTVLYNVELNSLATSAFVQIFGTNAIFENEVEYSIRKYYSDETLLSENQRKKLYDSLSKLTNERYFEAEKFLELPGWLEEAGLRVQKMRVSNFGEIDQVQRDPVIVALGKKVSEMNETLGLKAEK
ncbi:MAG: hypothetical protein IIC91_09680 [Chloroflexi bacterium]|nr:hypothetical protein [Chloroflexota bacterium]